MKEFLSIEKFKELKVLFILEFILLLLSTMLISVNKFNIHYWDWRAFTITISIWSLCSIVDKKTYWNLSTLLATGSFMYFLWLFIFKLLPF